MALRQRRDFERHQEPNGRIGQIRPESDGMRPNEVALQGGQVVACDARLSQLSKAGVDAIGGVRTLCDGVDVGAGTANGRVARWIESNRCGVVRDSP